MLDVTIFTNRSTILEQVYMEYKPDIRALIDSGMIPSYPVDAPLSSIPTMDFPESELDATWTFGSEVQSYYTGYGTSVNLTSALYSFKLPVTPDYIKRYSTAGVAANAENDATQAQKRINTIRKEKQLTTVMTTYTNYASGYYASPSTKWDASSGTTILKDIHTGIKKLQLASLPVTHMFIPLSVLTAIKFSPELHDWVKYQSMNLWSDEKLLQGLFGIPNVFIPYAATSGKVKKNKANVRTDIWGDNVVLAHIEPLALGTYPSFVNAYMINPIVQKTTPNIETTSYEIITRDSSYINFLHNDAAYILYDVLT